VRARHARSKAARRAGNAWFGLGDNGLQDSVTPGFRIDYTNPATINGTIAFVTGLISTYSSTSGVVLPTFLPTVPGLVRELGGGDPAATLVQSGQKGGTAW